MKYKLVVRSWKSFYGEIVQNQVERNYTKYRSSRMLIQKLTVRYCEYAKMMGQKESIAEKFTDFTIELDQRSIFGVS